MKSYEELANENILLHQQIREMQIELDDVNQVCRFKVGKTYRLKEQHQAWFHSDSDFWSNNDTCEMTVKEIFCEQEVHDPDFPDEIIAFNHEYDMFEEVS